jgi:anthranilate synthase component 2
MLLMIDNYDSFTYNLVQYLGELGADVQVARNDQIDIAGIRSLGPRRIVISPGPGRPDDAGISLQVIRELARELPILGVCLGHQCIAQAYGGVIQHAGAIMHGKTSWIYHAAAGVFGGLEQPFEATRYHSLALAPDSVPECLRVTAWTQDERGEREEIMGLQHTDMPLYGVQFHPESICTPQGKRLLENFLSVE